MGSRDRPRKEAKKKPKAKSAQPSLSPHVGATAERRGDPQAAQGTTRRRRRRTGRLIDRRTPSSSAPASGPSDRMRSVTDRWR